jgi:two-component system phosphate regulon sensor histidine kinase PhoR
MPEQPASVRCREGLLRQAIWNLAENAIKYRRPEVRPHLEVSGHPVDSRYELSVRDNGLGMSPDEASRVFDPFYRALRGKDQPGLGLGLSIVKRVVEACGGALSLDSKLGSGSTFVMRLPLA